MAQPCVAVAYSGGRDSSALLHATLIEASCQGLNVVALHVHHGLSLNADAWLQHCEQQCRRWAARGLPVYFDHHRLTGQPLQGDSIEAWARRARYAALSDMARAHGAPVVLLAHHRQDQAETFLLQALRGAGVAGLAAMPQAIEREGLTWARPWLDLSSEAIAAYVRRYRLRHVDDDSNVEPRFARNRLRLQVWPALSGAFPHAAPALVDAARWAREAQLCADDLALIDLARCTDAEQLDLSTFAQLPLHRRSNALRAWLRLQTGAAGAASAVQRLLTELPGDAPAIWELPGFVLRRYRGRLACALVSQTEVADSSLRSGVLHLPRAGTYALPGWGGCLLVKPVEAGGVDWSRLQAVRLAERSGGERYQAALGRPPRSLKKQFQALALPAWQRKGPLLYDGDHLLYVPGLGIDARAIASPGVRQMSLVWLSQGE